MHSVNRQSLSCPQTAGKLKSSKQHLAVNVVTAFNTWAFKREQPSDLQLLNAVVERLVERRHPLEFVLYWGKGPRAVVGGPELECLDYIVAFRSRIAAIYSPGANIRLICTDTHAVLNGHSRSVIASYFHSVGEAASQRGFEWCLLGDLTRNQVDNIGHICPADRAARTIAQLERSAMRWYKGGSKPIDGAIAYYDMNMREKRAVELEFPNAVFITFSGSELRELFPAAMPIFYMYSVRKGISVKPWFIDDAQVGQAAVALAAAVAPAHAL